MKRNLQEYALIAEIISAICIVLSLIFVGVQIQQGAEETAANSEALRSTVRQSMMAADLALLLHGSENPDVFQGTQLTQDNSARLAFFLAMIRTRHNYWLEYQSGLLDEATYYSYLDAFITTMNNNSYMVQFFPAIQTFPQEFMDSINNRMEYLAENSKE